MTYQERLDKSVYYSQKWAQNIPGGMQHFFGFIQDGFVNAAPLEPKTLQLIIVAAGVARSNEDAILQHVNMFIDAGGSREELLSGLNAVIMAGGGLAWASAGFALDVFDELSAAKAEKK